LPKSICKNQLLREWYNNNNQYWITTTEFLPFESVNEEDLKAMENTLSFHRFTAHKAFVEALEKFNATLNWWHKIYLKIFPLKFRL